MNLVLDALSPGLLESVYESSLAYDLEKMGFEVETQVPVPLIYKEVKHKIGFRKLADKKLGLLINFNSKTLKDGINRIVNNL